MNGLIRQRLLTNLVCSIFLDEMPGLDYEDFTSPTKIETELKGVPQKPPLLPIPDGHFLAD